MSWELFWHLNPKKLKPFSLSHKKKLQEKDRLIHAWLGTYGLSALTVAIDHCLNGKKAKTEYISDLITNKLFENDGLTQEEIDNREIQRMILAEEMWIKNDIKRGLDKTMIKGEEEL